eukprot:CAMPEP_0172640390 /NCGR_PEP_ID=MMETSP1068-20121228/222900_1 /TAXON_ID=35684 /ORGANISM="Pseudopedinella elastica, Strain CCMP716" /LENGTH=70 /DNA_ID=CAMNT_0013453759 /DNA_START=400 /DNA_END=612 /DNA_ORIENTATION=+
MVNMSLLGSQNPIDSMSLRALALASALPKVKSTSSTLKAYSIGLSVRSPMDLIENNWEVDKLSVLAGMPS